MNFNKMKIKYLGIVLVSLLISVSGFGQNAEKKKSSVFIDTLIITDHTTNASSERLTQLRKPIKRTFYLKNDKVSYTLFKGDVAELLVIP